MLVEDLYRLLKLMGGTLRCQVRWSRSGGGKGEEQGIGAPYQNL